MTVVLSLGGNLGNVADSFAFALRELATGGLTINAVSRFIRTAPVGCPPDSSDFLNAAVVGAWSGSPQALMSLCRKIETAAGRPVFHGVNQPRLLDIDIILLGDLIIDTPELAIPHPRAFRRRFVLEPLVEIAPEQRFPDCGKTASELLAELDHAEKTD